MAAWAAVDLEVSPGSDERAPTPSGATEDAPARLVPLLAGCSAEKRRALLREFLARELAQVLGVRVETLEPHRSFLEMGMDSLMAIRFIDRLGQGLELDAVLAFEFDCLEALYGHLDRKLERPLPAVA